MLLSRYCRFFKPSYAANLLKNGCPKFLEVVEKLREGGSYADIGCGFGISTLMIAGAFPDAQVYGLIFMSPQLKRRLVYRKNQV